MSVLFKPNGSLNVSTAPTDLSESVSGNMITGTDFVRCKNVDLRRIGVAKTRGGSRKLNTTAIDTPIHLLIEQGGNRYAFANTQIYQDEISIGSGFTTAQWYGLLYNSFNDTTQQIFAHNSSDFKRLSGS